jgi:hypothetical protein
MDYAVGEDQKEESWIKEKEKVYLRENLLVNMEKNLKKGIINQY